MKNTVSIGIIAICLVAIVPRVCAQRANPIKWHFTAHRLNDKEARITFTATIDSGWYIYSQYIDKGGPMPTTFTFTPSDEYSLKGKVKEESTPLRGTNNFFGIDLIRYKESAVFSQDIKLVAPATTIKGKVAFMGCSNESCLMPKEVEFTLEVRADNNTKNNKGG